MVSYDSPASPPFHATAFEGTTRLGAGSLATIRPLVVAALARARLPVLVFDDATGSQVDLDLRPQIPVEQGSGLALQLGEISSESPAGRRAGRPRLGVVGREVTLLPRHWEWLAAQPGGASVVLRRLVDQARKSSEFSDDHRKSREAAYRFMSAIAGNLPGFEEASRALFAGRMEDFAGALSLWPDDVRAYALELAARRGELVS